MKSSTADKVEEILARIGAITILPPPPANIVSLAEFKNREIWRRYRAELEAKYAADFRARVANEEKTRRSWANL